jgi:short-subunit dehydrogenase
MAKSGFILTNKWALITGASSGIGEVFARQLAAEGMHLILVARREDRLQALATKLSHAHGIHTVVLPTDLSQVDAARQLYHRVAALSHPLTLLVNNAGIGSFGLLHETLPEKISAMTQLNIHAPVMLTRYFLPAMVAGGEGAIINVASTAAFQPVPMMAAYGASKAFILSLTEALWAEYRPKNIRFLALCPGVTATEFFVGIPAHASTSPVVTDSPERVVREALAALSRGQMTYVAGHWSNVVMSVLSRFLPRRVTAIIAARVMQSSTFRKSESAPKP